MDKRLALMSGIDIPIEELQVIIHQPTIKEISYIGEENFFMGIQCLCLNKTMYIQDESILQETNNFQIFMMVMKEKDAKDKKNAVIQLLTLLFPGYQVIFLPNSLSLVKGTEQTVIIDENNFEFLQSIVSRIFCVASGRMDQTTFNPGDAKAKEIADKLMRARQRVALQNGETRTSILTQYTSVITVGIGSMSMSDVLNLTLFQLYDLMERYSLFINWDIDIRTRLAGGKPDSKPDNWMKNIH